MNATSPSPSREFERLVSYKMPHREAARAGSGSAKAAVARPRRQWLGQGGSGSAKAAGLEEEEEEQPRCTLQIPSNWLVRRGERLFLVM